MDTPTFTKRRLTLSITDEQLRARKAWEGRMWRREVAADQAIDAKLAQSRAGFAPDQKFMYNVDEDLWPMSKADQKGNDNGTVRSEEVTSGREDQEVGDEDGVRGPRTGGDTV